MLCLWHIQKNLSTNFSKTIKDKAQESQMLKDFNNIIRIPSPSKFNESFLSFSSKFPSSFQDYLNTVWLPVAEKFANAFTKKIPHFDQRTTSQIESAHSYIKSHLLGSQSNFTTIIKLITNALEAQHHEISAQFHQQKINTLKNLSSVFIQCLGKITHFALRKAQNNYKVAAKRIKQKNPPEECNNCHTIRTGIPCAHKIQTYLLAKELVDPEDFHAQWHLKVCISLFFIFIFFSSWVGVGGNPCQKFNEFGGRRAEFWGSPRHIPGVAAPNSGGRRAKFWGSQN